jgi:Rod binding domain-containing protein
MTLPAILAGPLGAKVAGTAVGAATNIASNVLKGLTDTQKSKVQKTATEFETMFIEQMLDKMHQSEGTEGPLGENGPGGQFWKQMLGQEHAKQITKSGGLGLSNAIMKSLVDIQMGKAGG